MSVQPGEGKAQALDATVSVTERGPEEEQDRYLNRLRSSVGYHLQQEQAIRESIERLQGKADRLREQADEAQAALAEAQAAADAEKQAAQAAADALEQAEVSG